MPFLLPNQQHQSTEGTGVPKWLLSLSLQSSDDCHLAWHALSVTAVSSWNSTHERLTTTYYHHHCTPSPEAVATALHESRSCASIRASVADMSVSLQIWRSHECRGRPRGRLHVESGGVMSLKSQHTERALAAGTSRSKRETCKRTGSHENNP